MLFGGALTIFWFLISYALSYQSVDRILEFFFGPILTAPILIFLPHGIRVIATYFAGARAIIPLFLGHMILYQLFSGMPPQEAQIQLALIGALSPYLAFEAMRFSNINAYYHLDQPGKRVNRFGPPFIAGVLAAILNGLGSLAFFLYFETGFTGISFFVGYLIGDILGLLLVLGVLFSVVRVVETIFNNQNRSV